MAFDAFLKIQTIPGECQDDKHQGWIEILAFNHGVLQPAKSQAALSTGRAPVEMGEHQDFSVTKFLDKSSPKLSLACSNGQMIGDLTIELIRTVGDKIRFMEYRMSICHVKSATISGLPDGKAEQPVEEVTFGYDKIQWTYTELDPATHAKSGDTMAHWDLKTRQGG